MSRSERLAVAAIILAAGACVVVGATWWGGRQNAADGGGGWLKGSAGDKFGQVEKHLRGLDQAMAEIGYRYGELHFARRERNWDYAKYQAEKIDLALRLALERRPKRAQSAQPFLNDALPAVLRAAEARDPGRLDEAVGRLHDSCVECHRAENVLHFRAAVERIRDAASR